MDERKIKVKGNIRENFEGSCAVLALSKDEGNKYKEFHCQTDLDGNYCFLDVPPGAYNLKVKFVGVELHNDISELNIDLQMTGKSLINPGFIARMQEELIKNSEKGNWINWSPANRSILNEVLYHLARLSLAVEVGDIDLILEHSADVANFCMKIYEVHSDE